mgnify:CR=1 FL=1
MKFFRIILICCCIIVLVGSNMACENKTEYLRIHVRANSDSSVDQKVKYEIKDEIVEYLTPILNDCSSKNEAILKIRDSESAVNRLIDGFLKQKGFNYTSKISIRRENFPTRVYDGTTLPAGEYEAVIVELGKAEGANWWCVVYPPLCFSGGKVIYKSLIWELFCKA